MKNKNKKAFTLVEMITSLSLIMIISLIFIINFRQANRRTDLTMTAQSLVADLHSAQNKALGLVKYGIYGVPAGGWGLSFDKTTSSYILFADLNSPESTGYMEYNSENEGTIEYGARKINLSSELEISEIISYNGTASSSLNYANVSFLPPDPRTNIFNPLTSATSSVLDIRIKEKFSDSFKTVRINFLGLMEIID